MDRYPLAGVLVGILSAAVAVHCHSMGSAVALGATHPGSREGSVTAPRPSQAREEVMAHSEEPIIIQQALVLSEQERMGISTQRLRAEVPELLLPGSDAQVELWAGAETEDYRDRDRLLLILPAGPLNGLEGHFVLALGASGAGPVAVRRAQALRSDSRISVRLEAGSGAEIEGRWGYSLRPEMRKVSLASFDDPLAPVEAEIFHAADFQQEMVRPSVATAEGGWALLEFELPARLLDESRLLDGCERLLEQLDEKSGGGLEWPEEAVSERALDEAATEMESLVLPAGRQFNLTLEVAGREMIRGKRLQPLVRFPITLTRSDGSKMAATLGCSVSGR